MLFRFCLITISCLLLSVRGWSQTLSPDNLLDINNEQIVGTETSVVYRGGVPAVLIEPVSKPNPETKPIPYNKPNSFNIKTPFGHQRTADFIDHVTDFVFLIQILDDKTIQIEEKIQFINTKSGAFFQRVLPKTISDTTPSIELLNITTNGTPNDITTRDIGTALILTGKKSLPVGVHNVTISYLVHGAIQKNQGVADISIDLTGIAWPLLIERFNVAVLFPNKTKVYQKELLFGSNTVKIPDAFSVEIDEKGNGIFQTKQILPAFTDVRLHMMVDADAIPERKIPYLQKISKKLLLVLICLSIMILYTGATILSLVYKKRKHPLQDMIRINPILWQWTINKQISLEQSNNLVYWQQQSNSRLRFLYTMSLQKTVKQRIKNTILSYLLYIIAFIRFNYEYIIGFILLIGLTIGYAQHHSILLNWIDIVVLGSSGFMLSLFIHHFGVQKDLRRLKDTVKKIFLETSQGINLTTKMITIYYPYVVCLGFIQEWYCRLQHNNPACNRLSFFNKEKK
jgi:hypothetical protein